MNEEKTPQASPSEPTTSETELMRKHQEEAKEYKDKYLLLLAEVDNTRKRMQKEKQEMTRFAIENVMAEVLQPIDNLENALKCADAMSKEVQNWAMGFQMILSQFKDVLNNHGVVAFHSEGTDFDPHKHEAVEIEETSDFPEGMVIKEFVKGYKCGERIIRAARVKVSKKPSSSENSSE